MRTFSAAKKLFSFRKYIEKLRAGQIDLVNRDSGLAIEHISDMIRYMVLRFFGGTWMDSSTWIQNIIPVTKWTKSDIDFAAPRKYLSFEIFSSTRKLKKAAKSRAFMMAENWFIWANVNSQVMSYWWFDAIFVFHNLLLY